MYKVAILGCENSHAKAFIDLIQNQKLYTDVEIVGVYSEDTEAAQKLTDMFGVYAASNYDEFVGQIDGLIITARDGANHYKYAKPYIASGIPMFIDKPITNTEEEAVSFMKELKAAGVRVFGGSSCVFAEWIQKLKADIQNQTYGKLLGGHLRAPLDLQSVYGGFFFYAQHLVQVMCELFGDDPKSVKAFRNGDDVTCVFRYADFDVTAQYANKSFQTYYVGISCENDYIGTVYSVKGLYTHLLQNFHDLLEGGEQKISYETLIKPVFIMNAIKRSFENGTEELIGEAGEI